MTWLTDGRPHHADCWREHLDCAGERVEAQEATIRVLREDIAELRAEIAEGHTTPRALWARIDAQDARIAKLEAEIVRLVHRNVELVVLAERVRELGLQHSIACPGRHFGTGGDCTCREGAVLRALEGLELPR